MIVWVNLASAILRGNQPFEPKTVDNHHRKLFYGNALSGGKLLFATTQVAFKQGTANVPR
jgi:hypothetical protein